MKLAIQHRPGSFSDRWIAYCEKKGIDYKIVDAFDSDIIQQVSDCDAFMWHHHHAQFKDVLTAKRILFALEHAGVKVFPDFKTGWHFDDKVAQKYLLEAIGAPLVPSYVFYDKRKALRWAANTSYPKVFKLRGGAGAENVHLAHKSKDAERFIHKAFGRGFKVKNRLNFLKERLWHFKRDRSFQSFFNISKGLARLVLAKEAERNFPPERNYAYFQDFIPNNDCDIRIIVIGKRAFAIKRMIRKGDFRASGSGHIIYDPAQISMDCVKIAFDISARLDTQSLAYDFVFDGDQPLVVEVSYAFARKGYLECPGYWTDQLEWVEGKFFPEFFMVEDFVGECCER